MERTLHKQFIYDTMIILKFPKKGNYVHIATTIAITYTIAITITITNVTIAITFLKLFRFPILFFMK